MEHTPIKGVFVVCVNSLANLVPESALHVMTLIDEAGFQMRAIADTPGTMVQDVQED